MDWKRQFFVSFLQAHLGSLVFLGARVRLAMMLTKLPHFTSYNPTLQNQQTVTVYFPSNQLLIFGFAVQRCKDLGSRKKKVIFIPLLSS